MADLKILDCLVQNFMSFGPDPQTIPLADLGLVLIEGQNEFAASAKSNGSGKSAGFGEAISWCIFGQTARGLSADDVVNDQVGKDCSVAIRFGASSDLTFKIIRTRKDSVLGNSLAFKKTEKGVEADLSGPTMEKTQENIIQWLGMSYSLFKNSTLFTQGNIKPFCAFTDKEIKQVFIEAMDLARFTDALEPTRADLNTATFQKNDTVARINSAKAEQTARETDLAQYKQQADEFETTRAAREQAAKVAVSVLETKIKDLQLAQAQTTALTVTRDGLLAQVANIDANCDPETEIRSLDASIAPLLSAKGALDQKVKNMEQAATSAATAAVNAEARVGTPCGECGRPILKEMVESIILSEKAKKEEWDAKVAEAKKIVVKAATSLNGLQAKKEALQVLVKERADLQARIAILDAQIRAEDAKAQQLPQARSELATAKQTAAQEATAVNPFLAWVTKTEDAIAALKKLQVSLQGELEALDKKISILGALASAFGYSGVPSFLLDAVVPELDANANIYASIMSGGEILINFSTTTTTKAGTVKDKFAIDVKHLYGGNKYKAVSGGEQRRADICVAQSVQDLTRGYGRTALQFAFYDEPFDSLDAAGKAGVIEMLEEVVKEVGTVLVVTHDDDLKSFFTKTMTVTRGKDGFSRLAA